MMDKAWVQLPRNSKEYKDAAEKFADMAQARAGNPQKIICPCFRCRNLRHQHHKIVFEHLVIFGMDPTYTTWVLHGESPSASPQHKDVQLPDTYRIYRDVFMQEDDVTQPKDEIRGPEFTPLSQSSHLWSELPDAVEQTLWASVKKKKVDNREEVTRVDVCIRGHTRKPENSKPLNDLVAKVVVKTASREHRGWVRGMGFGTAPSKVDAEIGKSKTLRQLQSRINHLERQLQELMDIVTQRERPTESHTGSVGAQRGDPQINTKCKLMHWVGNGVLVAEAEIVATAPDTLVHHVPLGPGCWKVWVKQLIVNVPLFRPTREFLYLKDAVTNTIAWPMQFVVFDS